MADKYLPERFTEILVNRAVIEDLCNFFLTILLILNMNYFQRIYQKTLTLINYGMSMILCGRHNEYIEAALALSGMLSMTLFFNFCEMKR